MTTPHQSHAAMLQLIAEGMRSSAAERFSGLQLDRIAGLLDRIAVDLLVPTQTEDDEVLGGFVEELELQSHLHS
jgi:hypothetical protein